MNIVKERKTIDSALDNYRAQLDSIPDEFFTVTPPGGGWSYAEVYSHILQASLAATLGLERCMHVKPDEKAKGINMIGRFVLMFGCFPPVTIKVPEKVSAKMPALKISKEEAKNMIVKTRKRMDDAMEFIKESPEKSRTKHPRLGMLTSSQWLKFIRIHLEHHLKQLARIQKKFQGA